MRYPEIIYNADQIIAINKPSGLLSIPDRYDRSKPSAYGILQRKFGNIFVVHRLDKATSGLLLFALDAEAHRFLSQLFENRLIRKEYKAIVRGRLHSEEGIIDEPITEVGAGKMAVSKKGKASQTKYKLIESFGSGFSLVSFEPLTGRTHQIRVHSTFLGHPIIGDSLYGDGQPVYLSSLKRNYHLSKKADQEWPLFNRLALHAGSVSFQGLDGANVTITADLPKDMKAFVNQLKRTSI